MTERSQFASNLGVAGGTLASRITGLARLVVFAAVIGQTALADAFDVGNNAPNVIYELLLGGTLTAVLVPLFVSQRERNDRAGTGAVLGTGLVVLVAITIIAVMAAPAIFRLYALSPWVMQSRSTPLAPHSPECSCCRSSFMASTRWLQER